MALSTVTLALTERDGRIKLVWTPDDTPADRWEIWRDGSLIHTLYDVNAVTWTDFDVENNVQYSYVVTGEADSVSSAAVIGVAGLRSYGVVDPLASTIRYTSKADVVEALGINQYDDTYDTLIEQSIVGVESMVDRICGRSFPDPSAGEIQGIPEAIKGVALEYAVEAYIGITSPGGDGGSDDMFGTQEKGGSDLARRMRRDPRLMGFRVSWGVAGGGSRP